MEITIKDGVLYHGNEAVADIQWRPEVWASRIADIEGPTDRAFSAGWHAGVQAEQNARAAKKGKVRRRTKR